MDVNGMVHGHGFATCTSANTAQGILGESADSVKDAMCIVLNNGDLMTMEGMTQTLDKISRDASWCS